MASTETEKSAVLVRIQLLGAFRVTVGERDIPHEAWRLRKAAHLVKLLALAQGRRLQKEQVIDLLWPELSPQAAGNNLRRTLHEARRQLEPDAAGSRYVLSQGDQLALASPDTLTIDVEDFERAAALARRAPTAEAYRAAVALYTGELLPQDRYEDWAVGRREALQHLYVTLLIELARLLEDQDEWPAAIGAGQRVVALEPANEDAHLMLMRLYALGGRRGQALQQYQQLENALRTELAVVPDPATQRLRDDIASGRFPGAVRSPAAARPPQRTNLPQALTSFVGREDELAEIKQRLSEERLLTLTGAGGSGKTRLALEATRSLVDRYADGVWLVELAPVSDPALVAQAVARALGVSEAGGLALDDLLAKRLAERRLLMVLDNCEHVIESAARLAGKLLEAAPGLTILCTSRQPLDMLGEATWPVPPLSVPPLNWPPEQLLEFEAIRLFVERARLAQWSFTLTPDNRGTVVEICRRLDGMPLAIELAAARLRSLTPEQIAFRLDARFALLTTGNRAALPRHQTLRAAIDWSYQLLEADERTLFERLAVFVGGCELEAIQAVCQAGESSREAVQDSVLSLLDKSLLRREPGPGDDWRVGMLETIQVFARDQLAAGGGLDAGRDRHARYYLVLAERAEPELSGPGQTQWLERLGAEHGNLRAALLWAAEFGHVEAGLRLAAALWRFWLVRGHYAEGRHWLARLLALPRGDTPPTAVANALRGAGALAHRQGDYAAARAAYDEALALARAVDDRFLIAAVLNASGLTAQAQGNYAEARTLYEGSLDLAREIGDGHGIAGTLNNLGWMAILQTDYTAARALLAESLSMARTLGNTNTAGNALNNLGIVAFHEGDYAGARGWYEQRLELARELGSGYGIASALHNLGLVAARLGEDAQARALGEESLAISRELGDRSTVATTLVSLGGVAARQGEVDEAHALFNESLVLAHETNDRYRIAHILEELTTLAAAQAEPEQAARLGGAAQALREAIHAPQPHLERAPYEQALAAVRVHMEPAAWAAAWAEGRAMTLPEVFAYLGVKP